MYAIRLRVFSLLLFLSKVSKALKAKNISFLTGYKFKSVGRNFKFFIKPYNKKNYNLRIFANARVGDNCWVETVYHYEGSNFEPRLSVGDNICLSDNVHISCVFDINIGKDVLIGSKVYIGDHSHGSYKNGKYKLMSPARKFLGDIDLIIIGDYCWIGDNSVILAGSDICAGCVIAANSVVKNLKVDKPSLIGGVPAKIIKVFEGEHVY